MSTFADELACFVGSDASWLKATPKEKGHLAEFGRLLESMDPALPAAFIRHIRATNGVWQDVIDGGAVSFIRGWYGLITTSHYERQRFFFLRGSMFRESGPITRKLIRKHSVPFAMSKSLHQDWSSHRVHNDMWLGGERSRKRPADSDLSPPVAPSLRRPVLEVLPVELWNIIMSHAPDLMTRRALRCTCRKLHAIGKIAAANNAIERIVTMAGRADDPAVDARINAALARVDYQMNGNGWFARPVPTTDEERRDARVSCCVEGTGFLVACFCVDSLWRTGGRPRRYCLREMRAEYEQVIAMNKAMHARYALGAYVSKGAMLLALIDRGFVRNKPKTINDEWRVMAYMVPNYAEVDGTRLVFQ